MAVEAQGAYIVESWPAGADLSDKQFRYVKLSSSTVVACSAATDIPVGVLQNKPVSGRAAEVCMFGPTKVKSSGAITEGALIGTSADGRADAKVAGTDTTEYICGRALEAASGADEIIAAVVDCINPARAA